MPEVPADLRNRIRMLESDVARLQARVDAAAGRDPLGGQVPVIAFGKTEENLYPGGSTPVRFYTEDNDGELVDRSIVQTAYAPKYAPEGYLPANSEVVLARLIRRWWIIGGECWILS